MMPPREFVEAAKVNARQTWGEPYAFEYYDRHYACVWARAFAAWSIRMHGATLMETGEAIGRDHSTVVNLLAKMEFALAHPKAYADVMKKYEYYKNALDYDLHS